MARKGQVSIQETVETDEEFDAYIEANYDKLICMEVYTSHFGQCQATQNAIRKGKLEIGQDAIAMVKVATDNIDRLLRFRNKSEPCFIFLQKGKLTTMMFGANGIELCRLIEDELRAMANEDEGGMEVEKHELSELLPLEQEKIEQEEAMDKEYYEAAERLRVLTLAARKKRVSERLAMRVRRLNFIVYWPLHHQAHYDLYEKYDVMNVNVAAKEEIHLTEDMVKEAMYMSDVDQNEACVYELTTGEALIVLLKMFDTDDRDFVKLLRNSLYEEIPVPKEDVPPEKQLPPIPAFERYASISKTAREVRRDRYEAKMQKLREEEAERQRLEAERARLAKQEEEERLKAEKQKADDERMARLAAGLPAEPEPEPEPEEVAPPEGEEGEKAETEEGTAPTEATEATEATAPTEATEVTEAAEGEMKAGEETQPVEEVFNSDVEVEDEDYIPPGGLFVPGFYCPPNDLAKANGLKLFFPKFVSTLATLETENLPPHVLVMFTVDKRHDVVTLAEQYADEILAMGIFQGDDPFTAEHVAFTIKQYDKMIRLRKHLDRMALMVSRKRSLPLLQLAGLNPVYISSDVTAGERDCLTLFPVGYGDGYEDPESVQEEEIKEVVVQEVVVEAPAPEEQVEEEEEEEG